MSEETAREIWTNAPEGFNRSDYNALHQRWPDGYIVIEVQQSVTPSTVDSPPEGFQDIVGAVFHGVDSCAAGKFEAESRDGEWLSEHLAKVPSGSFEAVVIVYAGEDGWDFGLFSEGGQVCFHALAAGEASVKVLAAESVERLDFSQPPPGYWTTGEARRRALGSGDASPAMVAAITGAAWAHYKARHDPPGFRVSLWESWSPAPAVSTFFTWEFEAPGLVIKSDARAAAWAWYERRLALALRFDMGDEVDAHVNPALQDVVEAQGWSTWPRILTWTDEQVAEVERWLVDSTAEMPEVLDG